jgi:hypothetical protein
MMRNVPKEFAFAIVRNACAWLSRGGEAGRWWVEAVVEGAASLVVAPPCLSVWLRQQTD